MNDPIKVAEISKFSEFKNSRTYKEIKGLFNAFLVAMFIRTFLFQPFSIPSGSMYPTLMVGDYLFVNKMSYGFSNHSIPFAPPLFKERVWQAEPKVGDVVVFFNPKDDDKDYIKRLIGKPGDRIQVKNGVVHINGEPVKLDRIEDYHMVEESGRFRVIPQYIETLPNGVQHKILKAAPFGKGVLDDTQEFIVPEGHYFLMGDNRDNSQDSRVESKVGYIPFKHLIGKAEILFFSTSAKWYEPWTWPFALRYNRIFQLIR